jgi:hypothetical protein
MSRAGRGGHVPDDGRAVDGQGEVGVMSLVTVALADEGVVVHVAEAQTAVLHEVDGARVGARNAPRLGEDAVQDGVQVLEAAQFFADGQSSWTSSAPSGRGRVVASGLRR